MSKKTNVAISGFVKPGFEAVCEAFIENFTQRNDLGAACCIYQHGEKVVDLWGGVRNKATGERWEEDTTVFVASNTKGLAAMAIALAHSRSLLDYEERVCTYWPEFAQQGKENVTVRGFRQTRCGVPLGSPNAFGTPESGGSFEFVDPQTGIGSAYVTNQMGAKFGRLS